ncbi:MOSC domain-containing protein [soil metagenome]
MLTISELYIYPIKSLGGISVSSATVTERGFEYDRRWMLIDNRNQFMTQRELPALALLQVTTLAEGLQVTHKHSNESITVPFKPTGIDSVIVTVWDDMCLANLVSDAVDEWFSKILSFPCRLVYMPDTVKRKVDPNYAGNNEITAFADGYPMLIIGQSSLDDLNQRLTDPIAIERFRPNIVFTGGIPFEEDLLEHFTINAIDFFGVKLCARCSVTTINQQTAEKSKEPLKTLAAYRFRNNNIYFGQNLLHHGTGEIKINDTMQVVKRKEAVPFNI